MVSVNDNRVMRFANYAQFLCGGAAEIILGQQDFTSNGPNLFLFPVGCSLNPEQDILWVVDPGNNRVLVCLSVFDLNRKVTFSRVGMMPLMFP